MLELKMMLSQNKCNTSAQGFDVGFKHDANLVSVVLIFSKMR